MSKKSKKEHSSVVSFQFFNSSIWIRGNPWPRTGSYPEIWFDQKLEDESTGFGWISRLFLDMGNRFAEMGTTFGTPCNQWKNDDFKYRLTKCAEYENPFFLRWWLDRLVERDSNALWIHVFDNLMPKIGEHKARAQAEEITRNFEKKYL